MSWRGYLEIRSSKWLAALAAIIVLVAACSSVDDPITRAIPAPTFTLTAGPPTTSPEESRIVPESITVTSTATLVDSNISQPAIASTKNQKSEPQSSRPTPERVSSVGIRPEQGDQNQASEFKIEGTIEWRPPPVPVPHSQHPDDHYWMARPLPSDSRNYDLEYYPYGNEPLLIQALPYRVHHGLDFPNSTGTPIFATSSGTVIWAGPMANPQSGVNYYGNTVVILHDWRWQEQNVYTLYAHTLELFVEVGDKVDQGQLIAGVGASGEVSGPHLHLEVRIGSNNYSSTRNPALWLAPFEGWGSLAGRFIDNRGRMIHGALITVRPVNVESGISVPTRRQRTYSNIGVNQDDVWQENFVVADLPAGEYTLFLEVGGNQFRRNVRIFTGQTNFVVVQADFRFVPTSTPTLTPTPTTVITGTTSPEGPVTPTLEPND
jgi:murein DD-endopeptidase MepM/ murein hydrolase activator NlpD